jgi:hypothetical protein
MFVLNVKQVLLDKQQIERIVIYVKPVMCASRAVQLILLLMLMLKTVMNVQRAIIVLQV